MPWLNVRQSFAKKVILNRTVTGMGADGKTSGSYSPRRLRERQRTDSTENLFMKNKFETDMNEQNLRGSVWRRWDLHLHTPMTKKEDQYTGNTDEEKWENFYSSICNYVGDGTDPLRAVSVIGITDYLSLDNYFKVKNEKNRLPSCVKLIIPNIEARMTPVAKDAPINIHFLFDPDFDDQIESQFLANLKFKKLDDEFSATRSDLIRLGRKYKANDTLAESEAYKEGIGQFVLEPESVREIFKNKSYLRDKVIIAVCNKSGDGVSGARGHCEYLTNSGNSQLQETTNTIYQMADIIFSATPNDREYFLGKKCGHSQEEILRRYKTIMPCVHGCDAHENSRIFAPNEDRYCWIKSDPTFDGLKQILYEPDDRVFIGNTHPSLKSDYNIIDRVEILGNEYFSDTPIYFNENLTCIIGGKSTGKSLLLHNMAIALDREQAIEKSNKSGTKIKELPELKITWRDGYEVALSSKIQDGTEQRKIIYIPQTYLNKLSDEREESTEIDSIIQDIVLQDDDSRDDYNSMEYSLREYTSEITNKILLLLATHREIAKLSAERAEKGDEKGVTAEITKLETQLSDLSKSFQVSEQDISNFQKASELAQRETRIVKALDATKEKLLNIQSVIGELAIDAEDFLAFKEPISDAINSAVQAADTKWQTERDNILSKIDETNLELAEKLAKNQAVIAELQPKISGHGQIAQLTSLIAAEKQKLSIILDLGEKIKTQNTTFTNILQEICNSFVRFRQILDDYAQKINTRLQSLPTDDLEFRVEVVFRSEHFRNYLSKILNNKTYAHFVHKEILLDPTEEDITTEFLKDLVSSLLSSSQQSLNLKSEYSIEAGLREVFINWYNINYIVKLDNDDIYAMSPGKKALVLLRLLISLAESKCPILIDQPEDDLDNRSIFGELIEFIKKRKSDRQIIVVTHNANIVVGSDAELVIVANQDGKNSPNSKYRFEYRSGSIESNSIHPNNGEAIGILDLQRIQGHICDILEGGLTAFELRGKKYKSLSETP